MSGCEICWERAQLDALLLGGSVADHYERRLDEIDSDRNIYEQAHKQREGHGVTNQRRVTP